MTEQPKYHLYAIKTADLLQNGLKAHKYSYNANGRYHNKRRKKVKNGKKSAEKVRKSVV